MVESIGIEHIDSNLKKGKPSSLFFLWFAANLTIADFALGFIPISLGMNVISAITAIIVGNILGSFVVGLSAAMGPKTGYPQMMSTTNAMGKNGMRIFGILNLSNTMGWFIVNNIIAVSALYFIFHISYWILIGLYVLILLVIAYVGHDLIHKAERILSILLGILFLGIFIISIGYKGLIPISGSLTFDTSFFGMLAFTYSYLMSWGPYASDYSRYLPESIKTKSIFRYTFLGSFLSTTFVEAVALMISYKIASTNPIGALQSMTGKFVLLSMFLIISGGVSANVLNLYSASLSGLVSGIKLKRTQFIIILGIAGFVLSSIFYNGFYSFFESFLYILDYWISPWIAILFVDFFILGKKQLNFESRFLWRGIISYIIGLGISVPFMNISFGNFSYTFPISSRLGGIDISYFISFIASGIIYYLSSTMGKKYNTLSLNKDVD